MIARRMMTFVQLELLLLEQVILKMASMILRFIFALVIIVRSKRINDGAQNQGKALLKTGQTVPTKTLSNGEARLLKY